MLRRPSNRTRSLAKALIGLIALALVAAACGGGGSSSSSSSGGSGTTEGGNLRIGVLGQIDSMNPFIAFNSEPYIIFQYIYPSLINYDTPSLKFAGDFATSWSHSSDSKTWTFHTVPNAKWSDGQPLTAADVAWNFNTIIKFRTSATANSAGYLAHMTSADTPDPNTVVVHYSVPIGNVLSQLQQVSILPEHIWSKYAGGDGKGLKQFPNLPVNGQPLVSGGPFMLTSYQKDQVALFKQNPNWYGPKPHIDGYGLKYYATDDAIVQAMKTGEIDVIDQVVPPTAVGTLRSAGFEVSVTPGTTFHEMIINSNPQKDAAPELLNPQVREALDHGINRQKIVQTAWNGFAQPGYSIVPPASGNQPDSGKPWTDPNLKPTTFDLALANKMLDDLGYAKGPDGIRVANGHPMSYEVIFPHAEEGAGQRAFQIIQADYKTIGVNITQKVLGDGAAFNAILAPASGNGFTPGDSYQQYNLSMWDWGAGIDPDFILYVMTCNSWGVWNDSGYCNKQYDQLYSEQGGQIDPAKRLQEVYQMQDMIYNERPYMVLNYEDNRVAWSKKWAGFVPSPLGEFNYLSKQTILDVHQVA